ncbi:hypothetical protein [Telluribacter humicola]|uniref:hypothetical protein n=1 Tax=Telluribacter humicola TaxID=1720261 RepID=UPI001A96EF68|nr:hypothetical protein [Telluribacter humicola]
MQHSIMLGTEIEDGKTWPIWHPLQICAKDYKTAKEVHKISGCPGGVAELIEEIEWPEGAQYFPVDERELWVLGAVLLMN